MSKKNKKQEKLDSISKNTRLCVEKAAGILAAKGDDYGDDNLCRHGMKGIVVRIDDKIARLDNLIVNRENPAVDESIEDTLMDIAGYAINAIRLIREKRMR